MLSIPNYIFACLAASTGGFLNGFDTGSIGAIVSMTQFEESIGKLSPTLLGFTVSLIMLTGAFPAVFAGHLAERFGRLKVIILGVLFFVVGAVLQSAAGELNMFLVGRALGGFGEGVYLSNVSVYICEIAPVKLRGTLAGLPQFMATSGVCFGYFLCYGTVHLSSSIAWRVPYIMQAILGLIMVGICTRLPDSPRWLVHHGRRIEALEALQRLDFGMAEAEKDILSTQNEQNMSLSAWQGFLLLFKRGYRARTVLALFVLGMVQLSGIDGVLYVCSHHLFYSMTGLTC
jgi:MFS family permease